MLRTLVNFLYKAARMTRDIEVLLTFNPVKIVKRQINKVVLRKVGSKISLKSKTTRNIIEKIR